MPDRWTRPERASPGRSAALLLAYALVHSALASGQAKQLCERWLGRRFRAGLYRPFFMAQSLVTTLAAAVAFLSLPDRTLYRVPRPWSWLMHLGQAGSLGLAVAAALGVGLDRITGLRPLRQLVAGGPPELEPEAQGPPPGAPGEMAARGVFAYTRHPANWGFLPILPLHPHMTVNRAVLAALTAAYLVLGSLHEEARLRARYGQAYERYRAAVPFWFGRRAPARPRDGSG